MRRAARADDNRDWRALCQALSSRSGWSARPCGCVGASSFLGTLSRDHRSSLQVLDMSGIEALEVCFLICKFFYNQKVLNDKAKSLVDNLAEYVRRLLPALELLNTRGLERPPYS